MPTCRVRASALLRRPSVRGAARIAKVIDLKAARQDPDGFRAALARRGAGGDFDDLLAADGSWGESTERAESLRAEQKRASRGKPGPDELAQLKELSARIESAMQEQADAALRRDEILGRIPNLPDPTAADGMDEEDFAYRIGDVAVTEMALYQYVLAKLRGKGFLTVLPPILVGEKAMYGTGFLPTEESNLYRLEKDDLYLTGTSEVALAGIHADERLEEDQLPARYAGFTTNFRREAGAAGKDTKGMFRVHQFDKVEMYVYCVPEQSKAIHEELLAYEEEIAQELGLPYRVMNISVGDLGAPAAKKYDIEAWFPTQERYREITSCSNTTDYQARRLNIKFRRDGKLEFAHTLNGTGATARALLSIMENFQDEGGKVAVPEVLRPFGAPVSIGRL